MVDSAIARAYDAMAEEYDAQLARNPVAGEMRKRLHAHFGKVFRPGHRVLDFTAGTGADALYLAARGISVTALDIAPGMLSQLEQNATQRGLRIETRVLAAEDLGRGDAQEFDGAISTFAGLNTIQDPLRLARDLATCVKPGGRVILHALNASCLWQAAANLLRSGRKREGTLGVGAGAVPHRLYNPFALWREAFAPCFELREVYGLSVLAAPALVRRWPRGVPLFFRLDRAAGRLLPAAGDFFVMDLERRHGCERV